MLGRGDYIHAVTQWALAWWNSSPSLPSPHTLLLWLLYFPVFFVFFVFFFLGMGGGAVEGDWGRITPGNRRGLSGRWGSLMSFIPSGERRLRMAALSAGCQASQSPLRIWPRCQSVSVCELEPDAASQWPRTKAGRRRPVKLQAMKGASWQGEKR